MTSRPHEHMTDESTCTVYPGFKGAIQTLKHSPVQLAGLTSKVSSIFEVAARVCRPDMSLRLVSRIPLSRTSSLRPECVSSDKLYLRCSTPPLHNLFRSKAVASGHNLSGGRPAPWLSLPPRIHQSSKASGWLHQRQAMTSGVAADSGDAWAEGRAVDARSGAAGASGSISRPAGDSPPVSVSEDEGPSDAQQMSPAAGGDRVPGGSIAPKSAAQLGFRITGEEERYSRWLTLYDRTIRFPPHGSHPVGAPTISCTDETQHGVCYAGACDLQCMWGSSADARGLERSLTSSCMQFSDQFQHLVLQTPSCNALPRV